MENKKNNFMSQAAVEVASSLRRTLVQLIQ